MILNLIPPTGYNLLRVSVNQTLEIPIVPAIDVSEAREATLLVRMHTANFSGTGNAPTLAFNMGTIAPYTDGTQYGPNSVALTASFGSQTAPSSGALAIGSNIASSGASPTPLGGVVQLVMAYTQYQSTVTTASVVISVDLVLKS